MKYPALDVSNADGDLLLALVDDFSPTALESHPAAVTIFFADAGAREGARRAIEQALPGISVRARDVDDEDWARRSQENLKPVGVGRIVVVPPWCRDAQSPGPDSLRIVIAPSMGFGTGHHATTRLCLAALQALDLAGLTVLDVGTGSGLLAIAARMLGAAQATGIDHDPDAIQSAMENLAGNPAVDRVRFVIGDLRATTLTPADVVSANLTGALLIRTASLLRAAVRPAGTLIVSGLQAHERHEVVEAFAPASRVWEAEEDNWVGLAFNPGATIEV